MDVNSSMPHNHDDHSSSCHDESSSHDHRSHNHVHDHSDELTPVVQSQIYSQIDFNGIHTLNEVTAGSGRKIIEKTWAQRMETSPEVESDADEQLIMHIPYVND